MTLPSGWTREDNRLVEIACVKRPNQPPVLSPVYMKVDGNKITAISDTPDFSGTLTGTGELQGKPWDWLIARKQIFYDRRPSQLWDIEMKAVSAEAFERLVADAHCPSF
jgi:hypothetical protein